MTKKITALVLTLILALSLFGTAMADTTEKEATTAATDLLMAMDIVKGMPDGSLELERNVTRAEAAALMTRAKLGDEGIAALSVSDAPFLDVSAGNWAAKEIDYCAKNKIIAGDGLGNYFPNNNVTLSQLMAISLRTLGYGDFVGKDWEKEVDETASQLPTFSNLSRSSKPAVREDVFETIYQSLFTPQKTADGQVTATIAEQRSVAVVNLSDTQATFSIKGVKLDKAYPISAGETFPAARVTAVTYVPKENGEICVLLNASESEKTATLIFSNGSTQTVKTLSDYSELSGSIGQFVAWNSETKKLSSLKGIGGMQDLNPGVTALSGISLAKDVQFIIHTKDEDYERFLAFSGIDRMPTIYEAEYVIYTSTDGKQYVYIANGQNSTGYYCRGQAFIVDPASCWQYEGSNKYYAAYGARNSQVGTVKFEESYGSSFFSAAPMPGIIRGASFEGMRVTDTAFGYSENPLFDSYRTAMGIQDEFPQSFPLQGISYENGYFMLGTNTAYQSAMEVTQAWGFKAENINALAFFFNIDSSGNITGSTRPLETVGSNSEAYVWGTLNSSGEILNLYIVESASDAWESYWVEFLGQN